MNRISPVPEVVFFVNSVPQAEDAVAVAHELQARIWIVPLWSSVEQYLRSISCPASVAIVSLAANLPPRVQKVALIYRGARLVRRILARGRPVFVFGDDLNQYQSAMLRVLRKAGACTVLIQDGVLDKNDPIRLVEGGRFLTRAGLSLLRSTNLLPPLNRVYGAGGCSRIAVFGASTAKLMKAQGIRPVAIVVTGSPRYDQHFRVTRERRTENARRVLCIGTLLARRGWGTVDDDRRWIGAVEEFAGSHLDYDVLIRPHPTEAELAYEKLLSVASAPNLRVNKEGSVVSALGAANIVVMNFPSTVLLEAFIFRRPVIFIDPHQPLLQNDMTNDPAVVRIDKPEDLAAAIANAAETTDGVTVADDFIERHLGYVDGQSARRVAALIDSLRSSGCDGG